MSDAKQVVELTTKPELNLNAVVTAKRDRILAIAASSIKGDFETWLMRAQLEVTRSEAVNLLNTPKGVQSALDAIIKAGTMGIIFGLSKPHGYFVGRDGKVCFDPSRYGIAHAITYGNGAVLEHVPQLITAHQNDGYRMDQDKGKIVWPDKPIDPFSDRGPIVGWLLELHFNDGRKSQVRYATMADVRKIQEGHANLNTPAYKKDRLQMDEKTAVKFMLRDILSEVEGKSGLVGMFADEEDERPEPAVIRDQGDRLNRQMDRAATNMKPAEKTEPVVDEPEPEPEQAAEPEAEPGSEELF